jgi:hypothetical protein
MDPINITNEFVSRIDSRIALLENQFNHLKESTNKEIATLKQLIKVTWNSIQEERRKTPELDRMKDNHKKIYLTPVDEAISNDCLKRILSESVKHLELFPRLHDDLQSLMKRISSCEIQIDSFNRCQNVDFETQSKLIPDLHHKVALIMRKLVLCETQIEKCFKNYWKPVEQPLTNLNPQLNIELSEKESIYQKNVWNINHHRNKSNY